MTGYRIITAVTVVCAAAAVALFAIQGRLVDALPGLLALAAAALAVIRWVRPDAESDMIRAAEITGYLDGMKGRDRVIAEAENVTRLIPRGS